MGLLFAEILKTIVIMKTLKDKAKGFILSLFNKVKNNEVVAKDYLIATLTPNAMEILKTIFSYSI